MSYMTTVRHAAARGHCVTPARDCRLEPLLANASCIHCPVKTKQNMAKVKLPFPLTGNLAGLSLYTRKDMEGVLARTPGGASKERILNDACFDLTRRHGSEFAGCSTASKWLRRGALQPLEFLSDFNWASALLRHLHPLVPLDTAGKLGSRSIALSKHPSLVAGYPLTRRLSFDRVVRTEVEGTLEKDTLSARVQVSELLPQVNFFPEGPYS